MAASKKKGPKVMRVVKKTSYSERAGNLKEWYEVQYSTWRSFTNYSGVIRFSNKSEALNFCLRKKAGALTGGTHTEEVT